MPAVRNNRMSICRQGHDIAGDNAKAYGKGERTYFACRTCSVEATRRSRAAQGDFLPPNTKSIMAAYKEPLKPVENGFGYYGTVAYDETQQYTQCHYCGNFYKTLGTHVSRVHGKSPKQYRIDISLPTTLSLTAPRAKNSTLERWASMSDEDKNETMLEVYVCECGAGKVVPQYATLIDSEDV